MKTNKKVEWDTPRARGNAAVQYPGHEEGIEKCTSLCVTCTAALPLGLGRGTHEPRPSLASASALPLAFHIRITNVEMSHVLIPL